MRRLAPLLLLLLAGCASSPGIPETTYYRLPEPAAVAAAPAPLFAQPLVVETFQADGLHSDQALLYALDEGGTQLRGYHYQLWVDPPVRALHVPLPLVPRDVDPGLGPRRARVGARRAAGFPG